MKAQGRTKRSRHLGEDEIGHCKDPFVSGAVWHEAARRKIHNDTGKKGMPTLRRIGEHGAWPTLNGDDHRESAQHIQEFRCIVLVILLRSYDSASR